MTCFRRGLHRACIAPAWPLLRFGGGARDRTIPHAETQVTSTEVLLAARCKKSYANAHTYHINSVSVNSDQETFLSADDLRVNLWNLEVRGNADERGA